MQPLQLFIKRLTLILLPMVVSGCAFAPRNAVEQPYANQCNMSSKMMTLDQPRATVALGCKKTMNQAELMSCLLVAGVIVPAGSFIVSGSIVLINNTFHWLEYQARCHNRSAEQNSNIGQEKTVQDK